MNWLFLEEYVYYATKVEVFVVIVIGVMEMVNIVSRTELEHACFFSLQS